jgi:hypothetical protein
MWTPTRAIRPNINAVVAINVLNVIILNYLYVILYTYYLEFFSNCTAKVMPLEKPAKRSDIIVYKGHAFLTAVKALDRRQFLSE